MATGFINNLVAGRELNLTVIFRAAEEGGVIAECLDIPGCMTQGDDDNEAKINIVDAINGCLSVMLEDCIRNAKARGAADTDLVGINRQEILAVIPPHLAAAASNYAE